MTGLLGHQLLNSSEFPLSCSTIELSPASLVCTLLIFSKFPLSCLTSESSPASLCI